MQPPAFATSTREPRVREPEQEFPRAFGAYVLLSSFAHGGMGEVYLAKSGGIRGIDRLCVLKKLRPDVNANEEYVRRFLDEARVVVQLSHPHIAHVFDVGKVGREHYLAMEFISGANLKEIHARTLAQTAATGAERMPAGLALHVLVHTLDALDYAHRQTHPITGAPLHVVHRDVSPQNIMVSYEGDVKLIDFGLAASEIKTEHTESQVVLGKVAYMSPEQARGERVDARTDQFSAAIVLYELLSSDRFYGTRSNYDIWQVVGHGGFIPEKWDRLDADMTRVLARALAAKPDHRYPSCADFKEDLERILRKSHPDTGKRALRTLMEQSFTGDRELERKFLSRFADVSGVSARASAADEPALSTTSNAPSKGSADSVPPLAPYEKTEAGISVPSLLAAHAPSTTDAAIHERTDPIRSRPTASTADVVEETGALVRQTYGDRRRSLVVGLLLLSVVLIAVISVIGFGFGGPTSSTSAIEAKSIDANPVDAKPVDANPVDANPVDAKPIDAKPVDAKPVDAIPVDAKPVDAKPIDAKPVDAKPVDAKPVATAKPSGEKPSRSGPAVKPADDAATTATTAPKDDAAPVDDAFIARARAAIAAQAVERKEVLRMLGRCGHVACASYWKREASTNGLDGFDASQDASMKGCLEKCIER
jgi:serine/threonine protein kinase